MKGFYKKSILNILILLALAFSALGGTAIPVHAAGLHMYVVNGATGTVIQANLDGTGGFSLGNLGGTLSNPLDIALDVPNNKMYVTNSSNNTVSRANLDGTGGVNLGNLGGTLNQPYGIALDLVNNKMYVVNNGNDTISQANLDGTGGVNLGDLGGTLNGALNIALDVANNKMYVVNNTTGTVSRANLDGTGGVSLGNLGGTLNGARSIALDLVNNKLYVVNDGNKTISQANLDGTGGVSLGNLGGVFSWPLDIALDVADNKMYVVDYNNSTVIQANLDGTGVVNLGSLGGTLNYPYGIALDLPTCASFVTVTNNADSGAGSLRQAIENVCDGGTITFDGDYSITLASSLTISRDMTIDGAGHAITVSGNNAVRVFQVNSGVTFSLNQLTVTNGRAATGESGGGLLNDGGTVTVTGSTFSNNSAGFGGGIYTWDGTTDGTDGSLTVTNSAFISNSATNHAGAIYHRGYNDASALTVTNCTFSGNSTTGNGGGIFNFSSTGNSATTTVTDSIFSGNTSSQNGGGIVSYISGTGIVTLNVTGTTFSDNTAATGGGLYNGSTMHITNSTFWSNDATTAGGGLYNFAVLNLTNSTFAGNSAPSGGGLFNDFGAGGRVTAKNNIVANSPAGGNCAGTLGGSNNLANDASCGGSFTNSSSILLGALGSYGGSTQTFPLLPGSSAIDAGDAATCAALSGGDFDQRGNARVGTCDIGSFESGGFTLVVGGGNNQSTTVSTDFAADLQVDVASNAVPAEPVDGGQVTFTAPGSGASATFASNPVTIASGSASVTATANATAGGPYTVSADANGSTGGVNFSLTNEAQADLSITKTDGVTSAVPGSSVTYTITASNAGPSDASGATVADTFPAVLTATWTCVGAGGGTCTASGSGNINDTVNLPAGGSVTYTISAAISAAANGTLSNTATVSAPGGVTDPNPANNSATDMDSLLPSYAVTYDGNGNTGGSVPVDGNTYLGGDTVTVLGNPGSLSRTGYIFGGWNTQANGLGTHYSGGNTFTMPAFNVTLYAQWTSDNSAPVTANDSYNATMSTLLNGSSVLANDSDANSDPLSASLVAGPVHALAFTFNADGTFAYTPANGYQGTDTFSYVANDGALDSNTATVTITISPRSKTFTSTGIYDGWIIESGEFTGVGGKIVRDYALRLGDHALDRQDRAIIHFATSGLPDNAVITKVTLQLKKINTAGSDPFAWGGNLLVDLKTGQFGSASALQASDFQAAATRPNVGAGNFTASGGNWYQVNLKPVSLANVNRTGPTQFRLRFAVDDNNNNIVDYIRFYAGNATQAGNRPVLVVEYYVPLP
jgi:uncharacterized repeat protein (TIGR02543 family)